MMIGLGTDLVGIARIRGVFERQGQRFLDRVYTPDEQAYCLAAKDPSERLAARWAAKEAVMKALGTGWSRGIDFRQIEVVSGNGTPQIRLYGGTAAVAAERGVSRWLVSLSHSDGLAIATVIASSD